MLYVEFSTSSISFSFISVPSGICFVFLSRACSKICMFVNILVFKLSRSLQFFSSLLMSTRVEVYYKPTQSSLSRPTAPIQCKFSFIMFITFRFKSLFSFIFLQFVS